MSKLINLLNESAVLDTIFENEYQVKFRATKIISKELGFIKWLVDNNKIDREKVQDVRDEMINYVDFRGDDIESIRYKVLLMLLAIQDEPLKFLVSMIK